MVREALLKFQSPSIRLWWVRVVGEKSERSPVRVEAISAGVSQSVSQGQADLLGSDQGSEPKTKVCFNYYLLEYIENKQLRRLQAN